MPETITLVDRMPASPTPGTPWPARELVGRSAAITRVQDLVRRAALADGGVLLVAPRGTDVESVARDLHQRASRPSGAFARVDCAAADPARLERLLFGAAPAMMPTDLEWAAKDSAIAAACGGTVFLKDVTDLPASLQARVARVARDGEVRIDGEPVTTHIRWMASAAAGSGNGAPGIESDVQAGRFRGDLHRRLAASRIDLPPLCDRAEDVPLLSLRLLDEWCAAGGRGPRAFTQPALALLSALTWPGNLAELQLVVERAAGDAAHDAIQIEDVLRGAQPRHARAAGEGAGPVCPVGQPARCAAALRARLHRRRAAAPRLANGRGRPGARHPASQSVPQSPSVGDSPRAGVRVMCMNHVNGTAV